MKLADRVIQFFAEKGIKKAFVVYGAANGDLIDAFTRVEGIEYVCTMHEQAGGFAAEGYAKVSGLPGLAIATSGPGGQNFVTSIANCFYDFTPCIFLTGQVKQEFMRKDDSIRQLGFQETPIVEMVKPITKFAVTVKESENIEWILERAWSLATEGAPGPVLLDFPIDVQKLDVIPKIKQEYPPMIGHDVSAVRRLIADLRQSKKPVLLVGGGARGSRVLELSKKFGIPAYPTWNALDIVTSDFQNYGGRVGTYGGDGRNFGIQDCDLLICIGTRISGRITGGNPSSFAPKAKKWLVNVDPGVLDPNNQPVRVHENVNVDAAVFVDDLLTIAQEYDFGDWLKTCLGWKEKYPAFKSEYFKSKDLHPYAFARTLSECVDSDAVIVSDCGGNVVVMNHAFETKLGQRYFSNNGNSPMGFSFCGAFGAWMADQKRQVVCVIGDGGFNMNLQEIQTFLNYKAKVKTFIIDNRVYGITKAYQRTNFEGRMEACGPKGYNPPDFLSVCRGYGIQTFAISSQAHSKPVIEAVLRFDGPAVCIVECPDFSTYEPRIVGWSTPIHDMTPLLPREELLAA